MWNLLYGFIPRLVTFQMMLFCFGILNLGFWDVFWSTKSARNRDLVRLTLETYLQQKGENTSLEREVPWVHSMPPRTTWCNMHLAMWESLKWIPMIQSPGLPGESI